MPERWEYYTEILRADVDNPGARDYLHRNWPQWDPPKHVPQSLIPKLNDLGAQGWELVHMDSIPPVGDNSDVLYEGQKTMSGRAWSSYYFCVFKRKVGNP